MSTIHFHKFVFVSLALGAMCVGLSLTIGCYHKSPDPFAARPFDSAAWAKSDDLERAAMARDAIRHLTPGLPESYVLKLLGNPGPDAVYPTRTVMGDRVIIPGAVRTYMYFLGGGPEIGHDSAILLVHISADGKVVSANIATS